MLSFPRLNVTPPLLGNGLLAFCFSIEEVGNLNEAVETCETDVLHIFVLVFEFYFLCTNICLFKYFILEFIGIKTKIRKNLNNSCGFVYLFDGTTWSQQVYSSL